MGIFGFWTERDWSQNSYYGDNTKGVISFFCDGHLWCQVSRTLLWQYFQGYRLFSFFHFSVAVVSHHLWSNLQNRKTSVSLNKKRYFKNKNAILLYLKGLSNKQKNFFCVVYTLKRNRLTTSSWGPAFFNTINIIVLNKFLQLVPLKCCILIQFITSTWRANCF